MIPPGFLQKQLEKSKTERSTSDFLRQLVLKIVDGALRAEYGDNYSMRCLQSSEGIRLLLESFGIRSYLVKGAVCFAQVHPSGFRYEGFWDQDPHAWIMTEFVELVDLTVSQLHIHPASADCDSDHLPAIWYHPADRPPPIMKYLPEHGRFRAEFPAGEDAAAFARFHQQLFDYKATILSDFDVNAVTFTPILHGPESIGDLYNAGYPWVAKFRGLDFNRVPFSNWIVARERELMQPYRSGQMLSS